MWIKIKLCKEDLEKVKALEGFSEENALQTSYTDWIEFIYQPERLNPETIDCAWIKWEHLVPPKDVKGIFIRFDNEQIWTDAHFYGSPEYKAKTIGNAKPVSWTFMERRNTNEKSVQC